MKLPHAPAKLPDLPKKKGDAHDGPAPEKAGDWRDQVARTTAALAVIAAITSAQNASEFSQTILTQAEASDKWAYYQSKSIKMHMRSEQLELLRALATTEPHLAGALAALETKDAEELVRYEKSLADAKADAEKSQAGKVRHEKQSSRFGYSFIALQAGVVVCTIAGSSQRRSMWMLAIALGLIGLLLALNGFTLWI